MASIRSEDGAGQGVLGRAVNHADHALKVRIIVNVNREHRAEQFHLHGLVHWVRAHDGGRLDEPTRAVVPRPTGHDLAAVVVRSTLNGAGDGREGLLVDDGAHVHAGLADVADHDPVHLCHVGVLDGRPDRGRHVRTGSRGALLALEFKGAPEQCDHQGILVAIGVSEDEILPAGFPNDAGIRAVGRNTLSDFAPQLAEDTGAAGKVDASKVWRSEARVTDHRSRTRKEIDHTRRQTGVHHDP